MHQTPPCRHYKSTHYPAVDAVISGRLMTVLVLGGYPLGGRRMPRHGSADPAWQRSRRSAACGSWQAITMTVHFIPKHEHISGPSSSDAVWIASSLRSSQ
jgi:hypothetical protein